MATRKDKAHKLDSETTELEEAAKKVSEDAEDLSEDLAEKPQRKPEAPAADIKAPKPKEPKAEPEKVQRPGGDGRVVGAITTKSVTATAPTVGRSISDPSPAPVNSVTHPPGPDER